RRLFERAREHRDVGSETEPALANLTVARGLAHHFEYLDALKIAPGRLYARPDDGFGSIFVSNDQRAAAAREPGRAVWPRRAARQSRGKIERNSALTQIALAREQHQLAERYAIRPKPLDSLGGHRRETLALNANHGQVDRARHLDQRLKLALERAGFADELHMQIVGVLDPGAR